MRMQRYFLILYVLLSGFLFLPFPACAQSTMGWDEFVEYLSSTEEQAEEQGWADYLEELQQFHLHPINVNQANRKELQGLPLLSEEQILDIIRYVDTHRGMHTLSELILLPSIGYQQRRYLPLFLYAGPRVTGNPLATDTLSHPALTLLRESFGDSHHELVSRLDIPLYHRRGYLVDNGYRGSPIYNKVYYQFAASRHVYAGIRAERDAGERGIDSYGGYVLLSDIPLTQTGRLSLQKLVVGDYKLSFGMGLLLNQAFYMGKTNATLRMGTGIRPLRGMDEFNFLRGAATTLALGDYSLSLFYSHRWWDATLSADQSSVTTIVEGGYHRTQTEWQKKGAVGVDAMGANMAWSHDKLQVSLSGYYLQTDKPLVPGTAPYRQIYPQGSHFKAASLSYGYHAYRWRFMGEVAYNGSGLATLNTLQWILSQRYRLLAVQRYYNYHYHSFFSSAITESGGVQNENGGMLRLEARPLDGVTLTAYADFFYNPWPRYGLTHSSKGWDMMAETTFDVSRSCILSLRYNAKKKENSSGSPVHHRLRLQWRATPSEAWHFTTSVLLHTLPGSRGEALGQTIRFAPSSGQWRISISGLYFHTTSYDSRVYLNEPNLTSSAYIPSFSGHGMRATGVLQYLPCNPLRLELKYGVTRYFDRETQGSSLQTIYSPVKNDVSLQAILKI